MDARDWLLSLDGSDEWPAQVDKILSAHREQVRRETLREVADLVAKGFPDPNRLGSLFSPYVGDRIVTELRRMANGS